METKPYFNWTLDDWQIYHANANKHDIPQITTRCQNPRNGKYVARVVSCQYEFTFNGFVFVSHRNPDPEAYTMNDLEAYPFHISELHSGFKCAHGYTRDDARASARKILIHNARGFKKAMERAFNTIGLHQWETYYETDNTNERNQRG